jgi:hypothetical protein
MDDDIGSRLLPGPRIRVPQIITNWWVSPSRCTVSKAGCTHIFVFIIALPINPYRFKTECKRLVTLAKHNYTYRDSLTERASTWWFGEASFKQEFVGKGDGLNNPMPFQL